MLSDAHSVHYKIQPPGFKRAPFCLSLTCNNGRGTCKTLVLQTRAEGPSCRAPQGSLQAHRLGPTADQVQGALRGKSARLAQLREVSFADSKCRPVYAHLWGRGAGPRCFSAFHKSSSCLTDAAEAAGPRSQAPAVSMAQPRSLTPSPAAIPARRAPARSHTLQTGRRPRVSPGRPQVLHHLGQVCLPGPAAQTLLRREILPSPHPR